MLPSVRPGVGILTRVVLLLGSHIVGHIPKGIETHIEMRGHPESREGRFQPFGNVATEQTRCLAGDVVSVHLLPMVWATMLPQPSRPEGYQFVKPAGIDGLDDVATRIDPLFMGE
jgi:hypothetical protein